MVIPKIEAPRGRDNHAVTSSFLAPTYELHLISSPAHEPRATRRLRLPPPLATVLPPELRRRRRLGFRAAIPIWIRSREQ